MDSSTSSVIDNASSAAFSYILNHVFLPPKLPMEDDFDPKHESVLLDCVRDALGRFKDAVRESQSRAVQSVITLVDNLRAVRDEAGTISERELHSVLQRLPEIGGAVPLYIRAQNAGIIISKANDDYCFEPFELSPRNKSVYRGKGRLRRVFPASAFAVSQETYKDKGFQEVLSQTLAKMSHQLAPNTRPKVKKAGQWHTEDRDTTHPKVITKLLMSVLRAAGKAVHPSSIWKNTREDVLLLDAKQPWRRSPMWLLVRVATQLWFSRCRDSNSSNDFYKPFMVFFLAHILGSVHAQDLSSDLLYVMNAKLAQRLYKLGTDGMEAGTHVVQRVMSQTERLVDAKWKEARKSAHPTLDLSRLETVKPQDDIDIELPELDECIASMLRRQTLTKPYSFKPTFARPNYLPEDLPCYPPPSSDFNQPFLLAAFENWVEKNLHGWLDQHCAEPATCGRLSSLVHGYYQFASTHYSQKPEASSVMLLTIIELWIACDKSACTVDSMLRDYDPEIPIELFQSLCLPFKGQMRRLLDAENYLNDRKDGASGQRASALRSFGESSAFSVRYFDQSPEHEFLRSEIETQANLERENKRKELSQKKTEYLQLMRLHGQSSCKYIRWIDDHGFHRQRHDAHCEKCDYKSRAENMTIEIHEWPLPRSSLEMKSVIFELQIPVTFGAWRDATTFVLNDVLGCEYSYRAVPCAEYKLQSYRGLSSFVRSLDAHRVCLLSENKPHIGTHRRVKSIADTTDADVCVDNGLWFKYYDSKKGIFASPFRTTDRVVDLCSYKLPDKSSSLQVFLTRPPGMPSGLPPNTVIARQSECPEHMSLEEFKAFCTLPLGYRIQWMNVLTQISTPSLDFAKVETSMLLLQTIHQAGPSDESLIERASHQILTGEGFGCALVSELDHSLQRVKENWESSRALGIFIYLASRLLSLSSSNQVQSKCLTFLQKARAVAFGWMVHLRKKVQSTVDDDAQKTELSSRTIDIALVCTNTFNVDWEHLNQILSDPSDSSKLLQSSTTIREYLRSKLGRGNLLFHTMIDQWEKLLFRALPILAKNVVEQRNRCLDMAIEQCWSDYQSGNSWQVVASPYDHWLSSKTASKRSADVLSVHFNLITAELLVNGRPLSRLPPEYESHSMYATLFGRSILEVMPSAVPGMEFSAKEAYSGYTVNLGMQTRSDAIASPKSDLLVHAVKDRREYDLLSSQIFRGIYPNAFVDEFVHWYDHSSGSIELRRVEDPWTSSPRNWWLKKYERTWRLVRDGVSLISIIRNSALVLSKILSSLEEPGDIHTHFVEASQSLEIELPRLKLAFLLDQGTSLIRSHQYRGMFVDDNQDIGALTGLQNKLVLTSGRDADSRLMIIPEGQVSYRSTSDHVVAYIAKTKAQKIHAYRIDTLLGEIRDSGNLQAKLFICYLHAVTSYCLKDPLTEKTGTEQALSILESAAVRSFDKLSERNMATLECIARLAAGRTYYLADLREMQTIQWDPYLSFLSQHSRLCTAVQAIFEQFSRGMMFCSGTRIEPPTLDVTWDLLERDLIRSSTFRAEGFGAEEHSVEHDITYSPRDRYENTAGSTRSFVIASLIFQRRPVIHELPAPDLARLLWEGLENVGATVESVGTLESHSLEFDSKWLEDPTQYLCPLWCQAHVSLRHLPQHHNRFEVMMWLSTMAYGTNTNMAIIHTLAAFYNVPDVACVQRPCGSRFILSEGFDMNPAELRKLVQSSNLPFWNSHEASLPKHAGESELQADERRACQFRSSQEQANTDFVKSLELQWPCPDPKTPVGNFRVYINVEEAMRRISPKIREWDKNLKFRHYLDEIANALARQPVSPISISLPEFPVFKKPAKLQSRFFSVYDIFTAPISHSFQEVPESMGSKDSHSSLRLKSLLSDLEAYANRGFEKVYIKELREGFDLLRQHQPKTIMSETQTNEFMPILRKYLSQRHSETQTEVVVPILEAHLSKCRLESENLFSSMTEAFRKGLTTSQNVAAEVHQQPRFSPSFFLEQLARRRWKRLSNSWQQYIVRYACALTELQSAQRMMGLLGKPEELMHELSHAGHRNWDPHQYPESLLLEVESGITIRMNQEQIAQNMRSPPSEQNAVMQLNMGEGKSSVIVPIVAAALADGTKLVRIVVAKPQSKQMFQMLLSKFGGKLERRIFHLPFSRDLRLDESQANTIGDICRECMADGGVLLLRPEHILSFKLMGIESFITGGVSIGQSLLKTQHFFNTKSRDVVDESDENFSVKFELIYTMGSQRPIEFSPSRWTVVQNLLRLVARFALELKTTYSSSLEVNDGRPGRFPSIRFLRDDAREEILKQVASHVCENGFPGFPIAHQPSEVRKAILRYITKSDLTSLEIAEVEDGSFWTESTRNHLLLLRGLIAGGVFAFAFSSKRWRVNYGLDASRLPKTKLAVPYRAKDCPTPRSEFSHPDVVIILTTLSYYYGGLDNDDLFSALKRLLKSDQAQLEYDQWIRTSPHLPDNLRQLASINIKDRIQCEEQVFPHLKFSQGTIDYFLSQFVFAKEMREFPHRISASGWDIGQIKSHPTTGFSGTSDTRHILPLDVQHLDLDEQRHTNALILDYLLRDENGVEILPQETSSNAERLLSVICRMQPEVRVILDVGAQVLEMNNKELAQEWLTQWHDHERTKAVVFFSESDDISIVDRQGNVELLRTSPFADQLDVCLVFLDEAHTRGTDLKLPKGYRAAVTLGPNLTKDRLVQACMRMRKLGKGQSVVFCVPVEIKMKILERTSKANDSTIEVADVISWAISETWNDLQREIHPWASQGRRFERQSRLWDLARSQGELSLTKDVAENFLEKEAQTLDDRYSPRAASRADQNSELDLQNERISEILDRCDEFGSPLPGVAVLQEEQERELSPEIEQERQIERPVPAEPEAHFIHTDLKSFVMTGKLSTNSPAFLPAFESFRSSSAGAQIVLSEFSDELLVTVDFARTVKASGKYYVSDAYQRPVQWILTSPTYERGTHSEAVKHMVVLSPFEAQELLPLIQEYRTVTLHIYAPRFNLGLRSLDALDLHLEGRSFDPRNVSRHLRMQLNLFAGQLYLDSYEDYIELCDFLGLAWKLAEEGVLVGPDGFITQGRPGGFSHSPIEFLRILMTKIRRNCEEIEKTHLGKIIHGCLLEKADFDAFDA